MSARIIELAEFRSHRPENVEVPPAADTTASEAARFCFWTGASGKRYVHTVYKLVDCPALPAGNYVLVRRGAKGRREILSVGRVTHSAPSLNLAEIRQRGAEIGADEVHVHLLAETPRLRKLVEFDLCTGQVAADLGRSANNGSVRH